MIHVVGHKSPDTDSVCAAIAMAELMIKLGENAKPSIQGDFGPETQFVLKKAGVQAPEHIQDGSDKDIFLVDHSELSHTVDNLDTGRLYGIVDHHKLGDITTPHPLEVWVWPVGSTCTIIKRMFDFYNLQPEKQTACLMLCAILSDTVLFKSATCTKTDVNAAKSLAELADVGDIENLGMEMFKAKSEIDGSTPKELLMRDYKDFNMGDKKIGIAQLEMVDISMVDDLKDKLREEMKKLKQQGRDTVMLLLTDIMKEGTQLLIESDEPEIVEMAFNVKPENRTVWLEGVMSRKKQVVPKLEEVLAK
ncbi:MAG: manganese-dependent inorganic pyrophosphatase [Candidatus Nanoarchaeia archaeon]